VKNNAGIQIETDPEVPTRGLRTIFRESFEVNVFGAAITAETFLPLLKKSKNGPRIVNMSSSLGSIGTMSDPDALYKDFRFPVSSYSFFITSIRY
jgi:NAD(P)-dependent dehydrogenase (short-subunit alcohol dehydrogenase family)